MDCDYGDGGNGYQKFVLYSKDHVQCSMFYVQYHVRTADIVYSCFKEPHAIPDDDFRDYDNNENDGDDNDDDDNDDDDNDDDDGDDDDGDDDVNDEDENVSLCD